MNFKKCILTRNDCYKKGTKMAGGKPTGIVVHSTGANNKNIKRYVQPLPTDIDYSTIVSDIGKNAYDNHWNHTAAEMGRSVCVHAFIGVNATGTVTTYQTLPFDICCWGVGSGLKGSYNYNPTARVQFEICEDGLTDETYFNAVFKEAVEFCAYLCKTYGFGVDKISSHHESYIQGYGGNHADCDHWLKKFGKNMGWFRAEVNAVLNASAPAQPVTPSTPSVSLYRVRKTWADSKSQKGAFSVLDNAKKCAEQYPGYVVFDASGKVIYPVAATPTIPALKSVDIVASEVVAGKWGNGQDRKNRLTAAGYDYTAVQAKVNEIAGGKSTATSPTKKSVDTIAREVIRGEWGNGQDRKNRLIAAGYNYSEVQARVNQLL